MTTDKPILTTFGNLTPLDIQKYKRYLPSAFDESLSILEKINKVIDSENNVIDVMNDVVTQVNNIQMWALGDGLQQDVNTKLETMSNDGTLANIINVGMIGSLSDLKTTYTDNLVNAINDNHFQVVESTGYGVINGLNIVAQATPNMSVLINAGTIHLANGKRFILPQTNSFNITTSDPSQNRTDIIYVSGDGVISYITGALGSGVPTTPTDGFKLAEITVNAGVSSIISSNIKDTRLMKVNNNVLASQLSDIGIDVVKNFGAKGNANYFNSTDGKWYEDSTFTVLSQDDTDIIQSAILSLGEIGGRIISNAKFNHLITKPLLLPENVTLDFNGAWLKGTGTNDAIHTAYYVNGVLTDLYKKPLTTKFLEFAHIKNTKFSKFNVAIYAKGMTSCCEIEFVKFMDCQQAIIGEEIYYLSVRQARADHVGEGTNLPAYQFNNLNGMLLLENVAATSCDIGFFFNHGVQSTGIKHIDAESCITGITFDGTVQSPEIANCYFENITGVAIDLGTSAMDGGLIHNNFFNNVHTVVKFPGNSYGCEIKNNHFEGNITNLVDFGTTIGGVTSILELDVAKYSNKVDPFPPVGTKNNPSTNFTGDVNGFSDITRTVVCYETTGGTVIAKAKEHQDRIIPFYYYGDTGLPAINHIPFCQSSAVNIVGDAFDIQVTTAITYSKYVTGIFSLTLQDGISSYDIRGRFIGDTVILDLANGKTCTLTSVNGVVVLTFSGFSNAGNTFVSTGIVKII